MVSIMPPDPDGKLAPPARKAISRRLRYEILRRDDHTCRYCGLKAGETELTIDHVTPVALGGSDDPSNLVAACKDCNYGKSSSSPDATLVAQVDDDAVRWAAAMATAAKNAAKKARAATQYVKAFDAEWSGWTYGYDSSRIPRPDGWEQSVKTWREAGLPIDLLIECARIALGNGRIAPHETWRYFCGVAWSRLRELQAEARAIL